MFLRWLKRHRQLEKENKQLKLALKNAETFSHLKEMSLRILDEEKSVQAERDQCTVAVNLAVSKFDEIIDLIQNSGSNHNPHDDAQYLITIQLIDSLARTGKAQTKACAFGRS